MEQQSQNKIPTQSSINFHNEKENKQNKALKELQEFEAFIKHNKRSKMHKKEVMQWLQKRTNSQNQIKKNYLLYPHQLVDEFQIKKIFTIFDEDTSEALDIDEMVKMFKQYNIPIEKEQLQKLYDTLQVKELTFNDFKQCATSPNAQQEFTEIMDQVEKSVRKKEIEVQKLSILSQFQLQKKVSLKLGSQNGKIAKAIKESQQESNRGILDKMKSGSFMMNQSMRSSRVQNNLGKSRIGKQNSRKMSIEQFSKKYYDEQQSRNPGSTQHLPNNFRSMIKYLSFRINRQKKTDSLDSLSNGNMNKIQLFQDLITMENFHDKDNIENTIRQIKKQEKKHLETADGAMISPQKRSMFGEQYNKYQTDFQNSSQNSFQADFSPHKQHNEYQLYQSMVPENVSSTINDNKYQCVLHAIDQGKDKNQILSYGSTQDNSKNVTKAATKFNTNDNSFHQIQKLDSQITDFQQENRESQNSFRNYKQSWRSQSSNLQQNQNEIENDDQNEDSAEEDWFQKKFMKKQVKHLVLNAKQRGQQEAQKIYSQMGSTFHSRNLSDVPIKHLMRKSYISSFASTSTSFLNRAKTSQKESQRNQPRSSTKDKNNMANNFSKSINAFSQKKKEVAYNNIKDQFSKSCSNSLGKLNKKNNNAYPYNDNTEQLKNMRRNSILNKKLMQNPNLKDDQFNDQLYKIVDSRMSQNIQSVNQKTLIEFNLNKSKLQELQFVKNLRKKDKQQYQNYKNSQKDKQQKSEQMMKELKSDMINRFKYNDQEDTLKWLKKHQKINNLKGFKELEILSQTAFQLPIQQSPSHNNI